MSSEAGLVEKIDQKSVHRICSGQVVVSLAVAVKELVENSLDGCARDIAVRTKEYGARSVEVVDNGEGIRPENFEALCLKHHTSKIRKFSDLENVMTFGFRGEALSSLCALCKLSVETKHIDQQVASKLIYNSEGELIEKIPCARETGTTVMIEDLFYSLPVRHKQFMTQLRKEFNKMSHLITAYCLIAKGVSISLTNVDDKGRSREVLRKRANTTYKENIAEVYDYQQLSKLVEYEPIELPLSEDTINEFNLKKATLEFFEEVKIEGFLSSCQHGLGRSSTDRQFFFVNSRPCEMPKLAKLINSVYHQFNANQNPFILLNIMTPPDLVDINLTPDKRTILIHRENVILALVKASMSNMYNKKVTQYAVNGSEQRLLKESGFLSISHPSLSLNSSLEKSNEQEVSSDRSSRGTERHVLVDLDQVTSTSKGNAEVSFKERFAFKSGIGTPAKRTSTQSGTTRPLDGFKFQKNSSGERSGNAPLNPVQTSTLASFGFGSRQQSEGKDPEKQKRVEGYAEELERRLANEPSQIKDSQSGTSASANEAVDSVQVNSSLNGVSANHENSLLNGGNEGNEESSIVDIQDKFDDQGSLPTTEDMSVVYVDDSPRRRVGKAKLNFTEEILEQDFARREQELVAATIQGESRFRARISPKDNLNAEKELIREVTKDMFAKMEVVGQFNLGFIIAHLDGDLFIVDQHAADEKYNFETLQANMVISSQPLAVRQKIPLTVGNEQTVIDHMDIFERNGFRISIDPDKDCGHRLSLIALPQAGQWSMGVDDIEELIFMLNDNTHPNLMSLRPSKVRSMFAMKACRKSVMVGQQLKKSDMARVVGQLSGLQHPWNCPHGRPTMRHLLNIARISDGDEQEDS